MGLFLRENLLLRCWGCSWALVVSLLLNCFQENWSIDSSFMFSKFFSPEVALHLCRSIIHPCMEYCCHVWASAPCCYLELLDKIQKKICRIVGLSITASPEPFAHCQNVVSLLLFYKYYFSRCLSELAGLGLLSYSRGTSTCYSDKLHEFFVTIPRCYNDIYVNSFISSTARLWNSLSIECFPLTYDRNDFKYNINRHLSTAGSF